jgi:hypothetical protein
VNGTAYITGTITSPNGRKTKVNLGRAVDTKAGRFRLILAKSAARGGKGSVGIINRDEPF